MPTYLIRLAQAHESFRKVELQALADLAGITLEFLKYDEDVGNSMLSTLWHLLSSCLQIIFSLAPTIIM
jgi:tRNA G10  N-methylase Trm11